MRCQGCELTPLYLPETSLPPSKGVKNKGGAEAAGSREDEVAQANHISQTWQMSPPFSPPPIWRGGEGELGMPRHRRIEAGVGKAHGTREGPRDQAPFPGCITDVWGRRAVPVPLLLLTPAAPEQSRLLPAPPGLSGGRSRGGRSPGCHRARGTMHDQQRSRRLVSACRQLRRTASPKESRGHLEKPFILPFVPKTDTER